MGRWTSSGPSIPSFFDDVPILLAWPQVSIMTLFIYASAVLMVDFVGHEAETQEDTVIQERSVGLENCSILVAKVHISSCKCGFAAGGSMWQ